MVLLVHHRTTSIRRIGEPDRIYMFSITLDIESEIHRFPNAWHLNLNQKDEFKTPIKYITLLLLLCPSLQSKKYSTSTRTKRTNADIELAFGRKKEKNKGRVHIKRWHSDTAQHMINEAT